MANKVRPNSTEASPESNDNPLETLGCVFFLLIPSSKAQAIIGSSDILEPLGLNPVR